MTSTTKLCNEYRRKENWNARTRIDNQMEKFKAETDWEERKIGMLEHELTIKMEKLKAETKWEHLNVDKEHLNFEKEHLKFKFYHDIVSFLYIVVFCTYRKNRDILNTARY